MQLRTLFAGPFHSAWIEQFRKLGFVYHAVTEGEAIEKLETHAYDIVLVRGAPARLGEMMELAPHLIQLQEHESEQSLFLRSILDNLPHMVFVKDARDLRFIRWNRAGLELIGIQPGEFEGKTDYDLFPEEEAAFFQKMDREVLERGVLHDIPEETMNTVQGPRILHTKKIPICGEDGQPLYLLGISEDITDLKEMKAQSASRLEAAREAERRHISRELHDELGQLLTALKLDLGRLQGKMQPELREQTETMSDLIDHTIRTVRRLATELRPQILDDLGLRAGLEWLVKQSCDRKGMTFELYWGLDEGQVTDHASSTYFRICQEALNNVVRHAQASHVAVEIRRDRRTLKLQVVDDGRGFHPAEVCDDSLGLLGIRERINLLGGTLGIDSKIDGGTRLTVQAPLSRCLRQP